MLRITKLVLLGVIIYAIMYAYASLKNNYIPAQTSECIIEIYQCIESECTTDEELKFCTDQFYRCMYFEGCDKINNIVFNKKSFKHPCLVYADNFIAMVKLIFSNKDKYYPTEYFNKDMMDTCKNRSNDIYDDLNNSNKQDFINFATRVIQTY